MMPRSKNLDEYLQWRLARPNPCAWWNDIEFTPYHGGETKLIWDAFQRLEEAMGSPSGKITVATDDEKRIDYVYETFGVAADGRGNDWILMPSGEWSLDEEDNQETHAERKILELMRNSASVRPSAFRGWMETLLIFVTKSPCRQCSLALAGSLGPNDGSHLYGHLNIVFLDYYGGPARTDGTKGSRRREAMPAEEFWHAVNRAAKNIGAKDNIDFFKIVWNDVGQKTRPQRAEDVRNADQAQTLYDYMFQLPVQVRARSGDQWVPALNPDRLPIVGTGGRPVDPRFGIIQLRHR
jgi:hypothetical protein